MRRCGLSPHLGRVRSAQLHCVHLLATQDLVPEKDTSWGAVLEKHTTLVFKASLAWEVRSVVPTTP